MGDLFADIFISVADILREFRWKFIATIVLIGAVVYLLK